MKSHLVAIKVKYFKGQTIPDTRSIITEEGDFSFESFAQIFYIL